ncbi:MAG: hypothetical protein ACRCTS_03520 [Fusobacteriaceae bacterium]
MPINIIKPEPVSQSTVNVQLKPLTTGMVKEFFVLESDLNSKDNKIAGTAAFKIIKATTNLTDEEVENLSLDDYVLIVEAVVKEMDKFTKLKKKGGFQKPSQPLATS